MRLDVENLNCVARLDVRLWPWLDFEISQPSGPNTQKPGCTEEPTWSATWCLFTFAHIVYTACRSGRRTYGGDTSVYVQQEACLWVRIKCVCVCVYTASLSTQVKYVLPWELKYILSIQILHVCVWDMMVCVTFNWYLLWLRNRLLSATQSFIKALSLSAVCTAPFRPLPACPPCWCTVTQRGCPAAVSHLHSQFCSDELWKVEEEENHSS